MNNPSVTVTYSDEHETHSVTIESSNHLNVSGTALRATGIIIDLVNGSSLS